MLVRTSHITRRVYVPRRPGPSLIGYRLHGHDRNDRNFTCRAGFRFRCFCSCTCGSPAGPNEWPRSPLPPVSVPLCPRTLYRSHRSCAPDNVFISAGGLMTSTRYLLEVRSRGNRRNKESRLLTLIQPKVTKTGYCIVEREWPGGFKLPCSKGPIEINFTNLPK